MSSVRADQLILIQHLTKPPSQVQNYPPPQATDAPNDDLIVLQDGWIEPVGQGTEPEPTLPEVDDDEAGFDRFLAEPRSVRTAESLAPAQEAERPEIHRLHALVVEEVADAFEIDPEKVASTAPPSRSTPKEEVLARRVKTHLLRQVGGYTLKEVGDLLVVHFTVVSVRCIKLARQMDKNHALADDVVTVEGAVRARLAEIAPGAEIRAELQEQLPEVQTDTRAALLTTVPAPAPVESSVDTVSVPSEPVQQLEPLSPSRTQEEVKELVIEYLASAYGLDSSTIERAGKGTGQTPEHEREARQVLLHIFKEVTPATHAAIGALFGISGSGVSLRLSGLRKRMETDPHLASKVERFVKEVRRLLESPNVDVRAGGDATLTSDDPVLVPTPPEPASPSEGSDGSTSEGLIPLEEETSGAPVELTEAPVEQVSGDEIHPELPEQTVVTAPSAQAAPSRLPAESPVAAPLRTMTSRRVAPVPRRVTKTQGKKAQRAPELTPEDRQALAIWVRQMDELAAADLKRQDGGLRESLAKLNGQAGHPILTGAGAAIDRDGAHIGSVRYWVNLYEDVGLQSQDFSVLRSNGYLARSARGEGRVTDAWTRSHVLDLLKALRAYGRI